METKENLIHQDEKTIKRFLLSFPKLPATILSESFVSLIQDEVFICCPKRLHCQALYLRLRYLEKAAVEIGANRITLVSLGNDYRHSLVVNRPSLLPASTIMNQNQQTTDPRILTISEWDLNKELCQFQGKGGAKVIRIFDNQSIACAGNVQLSSGVKSNDWLRLDHASLWIPQEFSDFKSELVGKVELRNYSYVAYLANLQRCRFEVDARLAFFRDDLVRIVKVHDCIPI